MLQKIFDQRCIFDAFLLKNDQKKYRAVKNALCYQKNSQKYTPFLNFAKNFSKNR